MVAKKTEKKEVNKAAIEAKLLRKKINSVVWANDEMVGLKLADHTVVRFKDGKVEK